MIVAVQPPAYFPPLGYTALLAHVDHFILADTFRYRSESFQNRSKLRNAQGGHWITIPLFGNVEGAFLIDIEIETGGRWREKHWRSFLYDYRSTMYFEYYQDTLRPFFDEKWSMLSHCVCRSVALQAELLGLRTTLTRASDLDGQPDSVPEIVEAVGADALVHPADAPPPEEVPVSQTPVRYEHPSYRQNFEGFVSGTTALDLLFNYGREAPRRMVRGLTSVEGPARHSNKEAER
jgi:hypothetical protein